MVPRSATPGFKITQTIKPRRVFYQKRTNIAASLVETQHHLSAGAKQCKVDVGSIFPIVRIPTTGYSNASDELHRNTDNIGTLEHSIKHGGFGIYSRKQLVGIVHLSSPNEVTLVVGKSPKSKIFAEGCIQKLAEDLLYKVNIVTAQQKLPGLKEIYVFEHSQKNANPQLVSLRRVLGITK